MNEMQDRDLSEIDNVEDLNDLASEEELMESGAVTFPAAEEFQMDDMATIPQPIDAPLAANASANGATDMDMSDSDLNVAPIPGENYAPAYNESVPKPMTAPENAKSADVPEPVHFEDLKASASQAMNQAKDSASQALSQAKDSAGQAFVQAKTQITEQVRSRVEEQKDKARTSLDGLHNSVDDFSQTFRQNNLPQVAEYTDALNGQIDRMSGYLKNTDTDTMVQDASKFARDNAPYFLAGAFVLGIAVGRFIRSSQKGVAYTGETGALVPVNNANINTNGTVRAIAKGSDAKLPASRQDIDNDDAFGERPIHASGYVPGGIVGGAPA